MEFNDYYKMKRLDFSNQLSHFISTVNEHDKEVTIINELSKMPYSQEIEVEKIYGDDDYYIRVKSKDFNYPVYKHDKKYILKNVGMSVLGNQLVEYKIWILPIKEYVFQISENSKLNILENINMRKESIELTFSKMLELEPSKTRDLYMKDIFSNRPKFAQTLLDKSINVEKVLIKKSFIQDVKNDKSLANSVVSFFKDGCDPQEEKYLNNILNGKFNYMEESLIEEFLTKNVYPAMKRDL